MNKEQFLHTKKSLLKKMTQDNYIDGTLKKYDWLISHFEHYCEKHDIAEITLSSSADFIFAKYLSFLDSKNLHDILKATQQTAYDFIDTMKELAPKTVRGYKIQFKFALDWLYDRHYSSFSGGQFLPAIHCEDRNSLISY